LRWVRRYAVSLPTVTFPPIFRACVYLEIAAADADCHGSEPLLRNDRVVGSISSGAFGPYLRRSLAFGFVEPGFAAPGMRLEVLLLGELREALVLPDAAYDLEGCRLRM
jgi:dimethylglycine dehydrogenase